MHSTCMKIYVGTKDPLLVFNVVKNVEKYIGHENLWTDKG